MARGTIWLTLGSILATLNITKAVGEDGQVIEPTGEYRWSGVVRYDARRALISFIHSKAQKYRHPVPFDCKIVPRSVETADLIRGLSNSNDI